eukprot:TRINITY_DN13561_c0_g1_i4.p1 TRINITY_DN13561_c0_g1~~TRINITY_DN13561_c0_g1_i4.p1  ORF type:complete len:214 (+),score=63.56 TRINITY_DN13561_c0_g1_i4:34-675(+)
MEATQREQPKKVKQPIDIKEWKAMDLRKPGGVSIPELQTIQRRGLLEPNKISEVFLDQYGFEDKFSEEELKAFKESFVFFDRDGDGTMATEDLALALRSLGFLVTNLEVKDLIKKLDPDSTGSIDIRDFFSAIADVSNKVDNLEQIKKCFAIFDKDNSGIIKIEEFRHVLSHLGDALGEYEMNAILKELDLYNNGTIKMNDLIQLFSLRSAEL